MAQSMVIIYFYKITNIINGKFYYGVHSTRNMDDGYFGSGTAIKRAILKYGKPNFTKEILKYFDVIQDAFLYEKEIVNQILIDSGKSYNLTVGGKGGFSHIDSKGEKNPMFGKGDLIREIQLRPDVIRKKSISMTLFNKQRYANGYVNPIKGTQNYWTDKEKAEKAKLKMRLCERNITGEKNPFYKKKHTKESLEKMSNSHKNRTKVSCIFCKKSGDLSNMIRWHLSNCKHRST